MSKSVFQSGHSSDLDILRGALRRNSQKNITGMIVRGNDFFFQVLEGAVEDVRKIYRLIERDRLHWITGYWEIGDVKERSFPEWSMALFKLNRELTDDDLLVLGDDFIDGATKVQRVVDMCKRQTEQKILSKVP